MPRKIEHTADQLRAALREELAHLWDDMSIARRYALNGQWSMQCENVADRIKTITRLVGPTPWGEVPMDVLELGLYQRIHAELGIAAPVDMERVGEIRAAATQQMEQP